ncbi:MAG: PAS domain S-box protein [Tepidisphaeraceae bacterium]
MKTWQRWVLAGLITLAAAGLSLWMGHIRGGRLPVFNFFPAIILIGALLGTAPAIACLLVAMPFAVWTLLIGPFSTVGTSRWSDVVVLTVYTFSGLLIVWVTDGMRRARDRAATLADDNHRLLDQIEVAYRLVPLHVSTLDSRLRYTWVHRPLDGLRVDQMMGQRNEDLYGPASAELTAFLRSVLERNAGDRRDVRLPLSTGTRHLDVTAQPIHDEQGDVTGVTVAILDITERVESEGRVRDTEQLLQTVLDTTPGLIYVKDSQGRLRLVNRHYAEFCGKPIEQLLGKTDREIWTVPDVDSWVANDAAAATINVPTEFEEQIHLSDGTVREFLTTKAPLLYSGERMVVGFTIDITQRKRAEAALRDSEQRLRLAQRAARSGVWSWNVQTGALNWSEGMYDLMGVPPYTPPLTLEQLGARVPAEDLQRVSSTLALAFEDCSPIELEFRVQHPEKGERWLAARGQVEPGLDGKAMVAQGITFDVTDRKKIEQERERLLEVERQARADAEHAAKMKDEFLSTLSHELRTPLNAVLGWASLLNRRKMGPKETADAVAVIERNARAQRSSSTTCWT